MKKPKHFQFDYPLTDFGVTPSLFIGNATVHAVVYQHEDLSLHLDPDDSKVTADIENIFFKGISVTRFVDAFAEELYSQIVEAARAHGTDKFDIKPEDLIPATVE